MKTPQEMAALLERLPVGYLGLATEDGPYVVPVNYLFFEGSIYLHSGPKGRKIDALQADSRVCFAVNEVGPQVLWERGCGICQIYESVTCFGRAEFVEDPAEKRRILEEMTKKFVPASHASAPLEEQNVRRTAIIRIRVDGMTGKANRISSFHTILPNRFRGAERW
jgi:nitroimidazol reductase NimA-like FMN-containing flavoprotein (pyridoxamine 5'-phosphate oxidase superfamily)